MAEGTLEIGKHGFERGLRRTFLALVTKVQSSQMATISAATTVPIT